MTKTYAADVLNMSPLGALFKHGEKAGYDLSVSGDGQLTRGQKQPRVKFGFNFQNRPFNAEAVAVNGTIRVRFLGDFGVLPYSMEDRTQRDGILTLLREMRRAGLACEISPQQHVRVGGEADVAGLAPVHIIAAVVENLMLISGWLDIMEQAAYVPVQRR